jgi:hypothetical protein
MFSVSETTRKYLAVLALRFRNTARPGNGYLPPMYSVLRVHFVGFRSVQESHGKSSRRTLQPFVIPRSFLPFKGLPRTCIYLIKASDPDGLKSRSKVILVS